MHFQEKFFRHILKNGLTLHKVKISTFMFYMILGWTLNILLSLYGWF